MRFKIRSMLFDAYVQLGIRRVTDIDAQVRVAMDYLAADREHYIEVGEPSRPEYMISTLQGVICRMVPLAKKLVRKQGKDCLKESATVLSLMVTENTVRYVTAFFQATLYPDASKNTYRHPVYRYIRQEDILPDMEVLPPQQIRPVATPRLRDIFGMIFTAIARFSQNFSLNSIPHKTERAMLAMEHLRQEEVSIGSQKVLGKLVPLARENSLLDEMHEDHQDSYCKELYLLITEASNRYVLKTHHLSQYFNKVIYDDVPGGCAYEPTEEKQQITYEYVSLEDVPETLHPLYN